MGKCNVIEMDQGLFEFNIILHVLPLVQNFSLKRGILLLFEGTTDLATILNCLATSFQFSGPEVMWCQDKMHRLEPLTSSSKNAKLVFTLMSDSVIPFTPDGLIDKVQASSNLKGSFIAFSW